MAEKLKIIPLGGLEQIGMNITAFEYEDSIIVVDCGLAFPEDDMLGIDLVIPDTTYLERGINRYLAFRRMIDNLDYEHPDTANYYQTNIEHDKDGNAIKTHIVNSNKSIVAPKGYKLSVSVKPCKSFWESDINGGFYIFHVTMKPKDKHQ